MSADILIVDDDPALRDALDWLFTSRGVSVASWASAEDFLAEYHPGLTGCLIVDIRMTGMSGVELFDELRRRGADLPVVFLTGHATVSIAVEALKTGARDFFEKPFNDNHLVDRVLAILTEDRARRSRDSEAAAFRQKLDSLSAREREVMALMIQGLMNKVIADRLGIAMRTVEVHRARVLDKLGVKSAVELAGRLAGGG